MKTASRVFSLFGSSLLSMAAAAAGPTITELSFVQNPESRVAAVSFTLGAESIVTLDVQTNGVSIGWRNYRAGIAGCAFGKINPAGAYRLEWKPWETWTDAPRSLPSNSVKAVITAWSPDNTPDYMDIDLTSASNITYYVSEEDLPYAVTNDIYKTKHLLMKRIHCANRQWTKGSPTTEKGRAGAARKWEDQHNVMFSQDYYIGVFETTQGQWKRMTGSSLPAAVTPAGDTLPMSYRTYNQLRGTDASTWIVADKWPNKNHYVLATGDIGKARTLTGVAFDLPTEAQWEYACRGGTTTAYNTGTDGNSSGLLTAAELSRIARWRGNSTNEEGTVVGFTAVGSFEPNGFGLYDTIGNVSELCLDFRCTDTTDLTDYDLVDPVGGLAAKSGGESKVFARGSSYSMNNSADWENIYQANMAKHRSAYRGGHYVSPTTQSLEYGFRLVAPVGAWAPLNSEATTTPSQSAGSRVVKFKYDLDADAIVTMRVLVDGTVVDGAASCVGGDVNRFVTAGTGKVISWYPDRSLEGLDLASGRVTLKLEKWSKADPPAYMALDLANAEMSNIAYYSDGEVPGGATNELFKTDWLLMRRVPAKDVVWWMGVATNATGASVEGVASNIKVTELRHLVKLSADYFIGVFPITERQLQLVSGTAPTDAESLTKPASLKHYTVRNRNSGVWPANGHTVASTGLLGLLRTRSGGYQFDLPTEAQWEFACRAATGSAFCDGNDIGAANNGNTLANVTDYGWVGGNTDAGETVMPVGLKKPNGFGLYDMHGNLWEWCLDFYDDLYGLSESEFAAAQTTPVVDPVGATDKVWSDLIVLKGGSISYTTPDKLHKARSGYHFAKGYCDDIYWEGGCTVRVVCPIAPVE